MGLRAAKEVPLILLLTVAKVIVELVENLVNVHDLIDLLLLLLDLDTLLIDIVLGVGQVFNRLRRLHDLVLHEAETGRELDGIILRNLGNQLDLFLTDLLVLSGVSSPNILAVDEEHADLNLDGDAL